MSDMALVERQGEGGTRRRVIRRGEGGKGRRGEGAKWRMG